MITRRTFLAASTAVGAGVALGIPGQADARQEIHHKKYSGPHEMPRGLTLLSIANADGTETLGIKTASGIVDVRKASRLLGIPAPLTMEELLRDGNAAGLARIAAASGSARANRRCSTRPLSATAGCSSTPARSCASASTTSAMRRRSA